jgi:hypothetical protein
LTLNQLSFFFAKLLEVIYLLSGTREQFQEVIMPEQAIPAEAEFTLLKRQMKGVKVRSFVRYRCALATLGRLYIPDTGETLESWICNLSQRGIGLNLERSLDPGTPLVIHLRSSNQSTAFKLAGRVIHATPEADGSFRIGCELLDPLTPEMLDELL